MSLGNRNNFKEDANSSNANYWNALADHQDLPTLLPGLAELSACTPLGLMLSAWDSYPGPERAEFLTLPALGGCGGLARTAF